MKKNAIVRERDFALTKEKLFLLIACVYAYIAMVAVNILSEVLPINGVTSAEVSDMYPTLFTPTGLTFSIWGVIYALLGVYAVIQFIGKRTEVAVDIGALYIISCALNIAWLLSWHYKMIIPSFLIIAGLLVSLMMISWKIDRTSAVLRAPFSIYYGWITVATIANFMVVLIANFESFWGSTFEIVLTIAAILAAGLIGAWRIKFKNDIPYGLTIIWAITGIIINHISFYNMYYKLILVSCFVSIAFVVFAIAMSIADQRGRIQLNIKEGSEGL